MARPGQHAVAIRGALWLVTLQETTDGYQITIEVEGNSVTEAAAQIEALQAYGNYKGFETIRIELGRKY